MTYLELAAHINQMTIDQRDNDVSIAVLSRAVGGVEVVEIMDFVNPRDISEDDYGLKESVYFDEINGGILHEGHCYLTVTI
jgi:hypothetical protein